jgi:hypothetical protein
VASAACAKLRRFSGILSLEKRRKIYYAAAGVLHGTMHSGRPYQYKLNRKKRVVAKREGLESDEEEVEDLCVVEHIEEILCTTYERKSRGVDLMRKKYPCPDLNQCRTYNPMYD